MSEEHSENGRINQDGEEEMLKEKNEGQCDAAPPSPGINSPRHSLMETNALEEKERKEPRMEFFDRKRQDSEGEGGGSEGEGSPGQYKDKDTDSYHSRAFVMVSPPISPGKGSVQVRGGGKGTLPLPVVPVVSSGAGGGVGLCQAREKGGAIHILHESRGKGEEGKIFCMKAGERGNGCLFFCIIAMWPTVFWSSQSGCRSIKSKLQ